MGRWGRYLVETRNAEPDVSTLILHVKLKLRQALQFMLVCDKELCRYRKSGLGLKLFDLFDILEKVEDKRRLWCHARRSAAQYIKLALTLKINFTTLHITRPLFRLISKPTPERQIA